MLKERLTDDMKAAMKSGDSFALGIVRMTLSAINNRSIEKRGAGLSPDMSDEEVIEVIAKEARRRDDAAEQFTKGGRMDLAENEIKERAFLARYLPAPLAQMTREEITAAVEAIVARVAIKDFPSVMKEAIAQLKGKSDGKLVGEVVKAILG